MGDCFIVRRGGGGKVEIENSVIEEYFTNSGNLRKNTFIEFTESSIFTDPKFIADLSTGEYNADFYKIHPIDSNRFLVLYWEGSSTSSGHITAKVITVNEDNTFTASGPVNVASGVAFPYNGSSLCINIVRTSENDERFIFTATYPPYTDSKISAIAGVFKVTGMAIIPETSKRLFETSIKAGKYMGAKSQLLSTSYSNKFLFITNYGVEDSSVGTRFDLRMSILTVGVDTSTAITTLSNTPFISISDALNDAGFSLQNANTYYALSAISAFHVVNILENKYVLFYGTTSNRLCQGTFTITESGSFTYSKIQNISYESGTYPNSAKYLICPKKIKSNLYIFPYRKDDASGFINRVLKFNEITNEFSILYNSLVPMDPEKITTIYPTSFSPDSIFNLGNRLFVRLGLNEYQELFYQGEIYVPSDIYSLSNALTAISTQVLQTVLLKDDKIIMLSILADTNRKLYGCIISLNGLKVKKSEQYTCGLLLSNASPTKKGKVAKLVL